MSEDNPSPISKKRGNKFGFFFFELLVRITGLRGAYGFLYFVCLHYLIWDREAVRNALPYIQRRFPESKGLGKYLHVYKLFISQGKQLIDRYALLANKDIFKFTLADEDEMTAVFNNSPDAGLIVLTSHIGNWQVGMNALSNITRKIHLLMRPEDNADVQKFLKLNPNQEIGFISAEEYLGGVIEVMNALGKGEVVSIMGDRSYGAQTMEISFIGDTAYFPYSAFLFAAKAKCPLVVLSAVKESKDQYTVHVNKILQPKLDCKKGDQAEQLMPYVQEFASELEAFTKDYPYQCFLFHNVWKK